MWWRSPAVLATTTILLATTILLVASCSPDGDAGRDPVESVGDTIDTELPAPVAQGAHDCVPPTGHGVQLAWNELHNPVVDLGYMTKDQTLRWMEGRWYLAFSERTGGGAGVGMVSSVDLRQWEPVANAPEWDSPDLTSMGDGTYAMTFQRTDPLRPDEPNARRLGYRTAANLKGPWSGERPLADTLFPGQRLLDAALAHGGGALMLFFKRGERNGPQQTEVARSESGSLDGPWEIVGEPDLPPAENYQLLVIDGNWHLLATSIPFHTPVLYELGGDPDVSTTSWLRWREVRTFDIPEEDWNSGGKAGIDHETANSAHLCDARAVDGHWYLTYAGSDELTTFEGRGHAKIGVARSTDLITWEVPPGR